jgi:hypothetical protein
MKTEMEKRAGEFLVKQRFLRKQRGLLRDNESESVPPDRIGDPSEKLDGSTFSESPATNSQYLCCPLIILGNLWNQRTK